MIDFGTYTFTFQNQDRKIIMECRGDSTLTDITTMFRQFLIANEYTIDKDIIFDVFDQECEYHLVRSENNGNL